MKILTSLGFVLLFLFFGCSQNQHEKSAQVRWGQFLLGDDAVQVSLSRKQKKEQGQELAYGALSAYQDYEPGVYTASVTRAGHEILTKKIGLGTGGVYTISLFGMLQQDQKTNQQATENLLHRIVEGAAAETPNAYLPQLTVMNDFFAGAGDKSQIRMLNLSPGTRPARAKVLESGKEKLSLKNLNYPQVSKIKSVSPGAATVNVFLDQSNELLNTLQLDLKPGKLYTLFVIPEKDKYLDHLQVVQGVTNKKQ